MSRLCERKLVDSFKDGISDVAPYEIKIHGEDFADQTKIQMLSLNQTYGAYIDRESTQQADMYLKHSYKGL